MPGEIGDLALDEPVMHRTSPWRPGRLFTADNATLEAAQGLLATFSGPGTEELRGRFGPERAVAAAPLLERIPAIAGPDINRRP